MFYCMDIEDIKVSLGKNIKRRRKELKLTQEALADMAGSNSFHIAQLENGKIFISCDMLARMCNIFKVLPCVLFETKKVNKKSTTKENIDKINLALENLDNSKLEKISKLINYVVSEEII